MLKFNLQKSFNSKKYQFIFLIREGGMATLIQVNNLAPSLLSNQEACYKFCENINKGKNREKEYLKLLRLFLSALKLSQNQNDFKKIKKNLWVIVMRMPEEIKKRDAIHLISSFLAEQIQAVTKAEILTSLQNILNKLQTSTHPRQLNKAYQKMAMIVRQLPQGWKPEFESTTKACTQLYESKLSNSHELVKGTKKSYRMLSIDGGGMRAIIPAIILVAMEKLTYAPISKLFDFIGGVSTGGLLALGLTKPHEDGSGRPQYKAEELLKIFTDEHGLMFQENAEYQPLPEALSSLEKLDWVTQHPRYLDPSPFFMKKFSNVTVASALTDTLIATNDYREVTQRITQVALRSRMAGFGMGSNILDSPTSIYISHDNFNKSIYYFSKTGLKVLKYNFSKALTQTKSYTISMVSTEIFTMNAALRASSATPTLFPSMACCNKTFIDGGVLQNNPAMPCIFDAFNRGYNENDLLLVSLGTGMVPSQPISHDFASSIVSNWSHLTGPDLEAQETIKKLLGPGAYHRFQYRFPDQAPPLDDVKSETLELLQDAGHGFVEDNIDQLRDLCKQLMPEYI